MVCSPWMFSLLVTESFVTDLGSKVTFAADTGTRMPSEVRCKH